MICRTLFMVLVATPIVFGYIGWEHVYGSVSIETFIRCDPSIPIWHGELSIFEADPVGASELFKTVNFTTTDMSQHLMFEPFHPGSDWGLEYEIGYQLIHNCTHSGQKLCISPTPTDVSAFGK
ncbi:hypothetical protein CAEBREN_19758 [Caenorhabditis brenneri]|uniref:Uncharacterized protein n=1 Tax=Caenorhabditis brenneri TaxID=135651 RepID=G0N237_CAEBE|nr:hypothetical protein CAEBREN_19758 [Caenorhabditis brenneri]